MVRVFDSHIKMVIRGRVGEFGVNGVGLLVLHEVDTGLAGRIAGGARLIIATQKDVARPKTSLGDRSQEIFSNLMYRID